MFYSGDMLSDGRDHSNDVYASHARCLCSSCPYRRRLEIEKEKGQELAQRLGDLNTDAGHLEMKERAEYCEMFLRCKFQRLTYAMPCRQNAKHFALCETSSCSGVGECIKQMVTNKECESFLQTRFKRSKGGFHGWNNRTWYT